MQIQLTAAENIFPLRVRFISVACCLSSKKVVQGLKMSDNLESLLKKGLQMGRSLETRCTERLVKEGVLSGLLPSPTPFLPPILGQNVQQVLVESPG